MESETEQKANIPIRDNPQQNIFAFGNIIFSSKFDSGNLGKATQIDNLHVYPL